ncbi:class I mannose-6-phosphate isomerase [Actinoplanes derwentensis]|uniref:Mannose-6-phosphate isomerase n=1 Tax=Actinoplanes derwentensis TaxID=113562 RepID=A0A1H1ZW90_9ACTN|nr:class I mannose-6-phosphate isomerase [Actinoplanes derwentensis]GID83525.1 mannose-6-phosphate isomerase [Actinoplanes derwentensis]SDT37662.1 mannose-6-phosphate isomerase [Actinoplanes derwentensis]
MTVVKLPANQPETFYRGAGRIAAFRDEPGLPDRPEDWVGSTTARYDLHPSGLTTLPGGDLLTDAITAEPGRWLGPGRTDTGVLVKLLDAGQRLPLHVHPGRRFATDHLASPYGKTEAWVIADAKPDAYVHLGFARDVEPEELAGWVTAQRSAEMLAATNRVPVASGDAILCPAGVPHAIGDGILLVEVQEPTDFSVLLEYQDFGLTGGHLGLGYDLALQCVDRSAWSPARLETLRGTDHLLPPDADPFFRAHRFHDGDPIPPGFAVAVTLSGQGRLTGPHDNLQIKSGDTLLIPYESGPLHVHGPVDLIHLSHAA